MVGRDTSSDEAQKGKTESMNVLALVSPRPEPGPAPIKTSGPQLWSEGRVHAKTKGKVSDGTALPVRRMKEATCRRSLYTPTATFSNPFISDHEEGGTQVTSAFWCLLAGWALLGSGRPVALGFCNKPPCSHFNAVEVKGSPSKGSVVMSTPTFSQPHGAAAPAPVLIGRSPNTVGCSALAFAKCHIFSDSCVERAVFLARPRRHISNLSLEDGEPGTCAS